MKTRIIHTTLIAAIIFAALSCNKSEHLTTPEDIFAGKWRLIQTATDDNNNKILDPQELRTMDEKDLVIYAFHLDGSGVEEKNYYGVINDYYFKWKVLGASAYLQRVMYDGDTLTQSILTFSPLNTTLLDTTHIVYAWYIIKKYN